jgi:hypothetical protein
MPEPPAAATVMIARRGRAGMDQLEAARRRILARTHTFAQMVSDFDTLVDARALRAASKPVRAVRPNAGGAWTFTIPPALEGVW